MFRAHYRGKDVTRVTGCTQRQLRNWRETGLFSASARPHRHYRYTLRDLIRLKVLTLLLARMTLQQLRPLQSKCDGILNDPRIDLAGCHVIVNRNCVLVFGGLYRLLGEFEVVLNVPQFLREAHQTLHMDPPEEYVRIVEEKPRKGGGSAGDRDREPYDAPY